MKRLLLVVLLLAACGDPAPPTPTPEPTPAPRNGVLEEIRARGTLRVGTEFNSKPMVYVAEDGSHTGFEYRLMQGLARHLGVSLEPVGGTFKNLPETMNAGAVDVVIGGWIPSPDTPAVFSKSYLETGLCMVVREGSAIRSIEDLAGKKVGIYADPTVEAWAARALAAADVRALSDGYFKLLVAEDLDAVVYDYPYAVAEMEPYREQLRVAQLNLSAIRYTVLIPPGNDALRVAVDEYVDGLRASAEYRALLKEFLTADALPAVGEPPAGVRVHVARGDASLHRIAEEVYGDADGWKRLWKANKDHIAFPELVPEGTRVLAP